MLKGTPTSNGNVKVMVLTEELLRNNIRIRPKQCLPYERN